MSFILDALRKSESERQRDAATSLSRAPLATARQRTPAWSWVLISLLTLALLVITTVWWQSDQDGISPGAGSLTGEAIVETAFRESPGLEITSPASRTDESSALLPAEASATTAPGTTAPATAPANLIPVPLRPARELTVLDPNLPRFRLELLAYNGRDPAGSSAWINGQRYFVGERVANGPELVEVRADGVILTYGGQRFLLTTR